MVESPMAGALVPAVKSEQQPPSTADAPSQPLLQAAEEEKADMETDKDTFCPICMEIIKDAFLTACGHSFCYRCIFTHLRNKNNCPCCGYFLTTKHIFPNLLLNKLLKRMSAAQVAKFASPVQHLRQALQQGYEVSVKEVDGLLALLEEKKRKMEQKEAETNMQILHEFLYFLRKQKLAALNEIQTDLQSIKEDIHAVESYRKEIHMASDRCLLKRRTLDDVQGCPGSSNSHNSQKKTDEKAQVSSQGVRIGDVCGASDSQHVTQLALPTARKRRVQAQFNDLQEYYLQKRRHWTRLSLKQGETDKSAISKEGYNPALKDFQSVLTNFTQYSRLRVIAEPRHGDLFHAANVVSSIEFDRDDELFATAGVSRRIKIFEFSSVVNEPTDVHYPIMEVPTRAKLSCLSWSKHTKNHIASCDYEGIVTVWDATTRQSVMEYEEHEKRTWSVDFSCTEPSMLVSGSDDFKVKIWSTKQEASALSIDMKANICSVKYNPGSSVHVAVGSADRNIYYYDLRNISQPLYVFSGHRRTVSYVKFLSSNELASASIDSTLRLWDVRENLPIRTFRGHTNEKYFVGLSVNSEYMVCGSETNEVFAYHKAVSKPAASYRFSSDVDDVYDNVASYFISAVCWKSDSPTMLAANRQGTIKVLVLAA